MIHDSRRIMGTPFWLFIAPVCALAAIINRKREPLVKTEEPIDTWEAVEFCRDCDRSELHTLRQFQDERGIESECSVCQWLGWRA